MADFDPRELISHEERTRTELAANRRRFGRSGISVIHGPETQVFQLPGEFAKPVYVRSAWRGDVGKRSPLEDILLLVIERYVPRVAIVVIGALILVAAGFTAWQHFHPVAR